MQAAMTRRYSVLMVLVLGLGGLSCGGPEGKIAESSKTDECRDDILGGLEAFKRDLGLDYEINQTDADTMFSEGQIGKRYGRDGVRHEVRFGLDVTDGGGCSMRFFQKRTQEPGSTQTRSGNFGSVDLQACKCE